MGQVKYAKSMYEDTHLPFALGKKLELELER